LVVVVRVLPQHRQFRLQLGRHHFLLIQRLAVVMLLVIIVSKVGLVRQVAAAAF
jgi:hypothetical protein